jgi:ERCC4-type nuclease
LQSFRSVKNIKTASLEALMAVVDAKKAKIVFDFFQKESD